MVTSVHTRSRLLRWNSLLVLYLILLLGFSANGQVTASISDGLWSSGANWSNGVPANGGTATISHNMTMDQNITVFDGNYTLTNSGSIIDPTGGSDYNLDIRGTGNFDVSGKIIVGGDFEIRNFGNVILNGCDSIVVGGDADFQNDGTITIANCAALLISGDFEYTGDFVGTVNGNIEVDGEITGRNSGNITGTGRMCSDGPLDFKNSSQAFGSSTDCNSLPCCVGTGSGLPISLTNFSSEFISENSIEVSWETTSEINNDFFTIEYSSDGIWFHAFANVHGAGTTNLSNRYSVIYDDKVNTTNYFRLTQTDFDGTSTTFNVVKLDNYNSDEQSSSTENLFAIFPNPGYGTSIELRLTYSESFELFIENIKGDVVYRDLHTPDNNSNYTYLDFQLNPGLYFITYKSISGISTQKYLVR